MSKYVDVGSSSSLPRNMHLTAIPCYLDSNRPRLSDCPDCSVPCVVQIYHAGAPVKTPHHTMVWETLVNLVCRPPRYSYDPDDVLGPKRFRIDGRLFERIDIEVAMSAKLRIPVHFVPCFLYA